MAGLTVDQLSASFDARLDNNAQNLILFSGSFNTRIEELQEGSVLGKVNTLSGSHTALSASFTSNSASFNSRINTIKASELALSASVSDDVTSVTADINGLNDFSASITSSFNSLSASVSSNSASFNSRINTLRAGGVTFEDFNALTQSLSGVISSSAQLNNATITNLTITNLTTINETASVVFSSGSNQFGDNLNDTQILSGSVHIVGSGSLNGYTLLTSNNTSSFLTSLNGALSSSAQVLNGSGIFSSSAQLPSGLVSASSQVLNGSGIFSSSAQLPSGLVSSSIVGTSAQLAIFGADNSLISNEHLNLTNANKTLAVGLLGYTEGAPEALLVTNLENSINIATFRAAQNTYTQVNIQNTNDGANASTDLVATANNGTETDKYVNLGINSSNYTAGFVGFANDGYLINAGDDLYIGSISTGSHGHVHLFGGNKWQSSSISIYQNGKIGINTDKLDPNADTIPTAGYDIEISGSTKFGNNVSITSSLEVSGSTLFSELTGSLSSFSSSINTRINNGASIDTTSFATTGSNAFTGSQNINGDLIITGSTLSVKKSTDSDSFFIVDANSKRLTLGQGNGEIPGEFYLALSGSSAFSPRPEKTLLYGARGFKFQTNQGTVSEFTGSLTISSSAAVDLKVIGKMDVTGSLHISSSNSIDWYMPQLRLYQRNPSEAQSGLTLNHWNNTLDAYSSLQLYAFSNESWIQSTEKILKISGPTVQLSGLNSDPGNVNVIGKLNVTGSLEVSSSNTLTWYTPKLDIYNPNPSDATSFQLNKYDTSLGGYYNFTIRNNGDANNGTWLTNGGQPIKLMTSTIQLSDSNGNPGNVNVIGKLNVTGSIGVSGSIVPAVGSGEYTSSFSLGSPTAAWKDIYVSDGTINFLGSTGNTIGQLSATADGLSSLSLLVGTSSFGGNPVGQLYIGQGRTNNPNNVAIGVNALNSVDTSGGGADGMFNVAVGSYALSQVAAGQGNTAMGHNAMGGANGYYNTAIGSYAGYAGGGNANVFVGYNAGKQITNTGAGGGNVALGYEALMSNGTDAYFAANVAIGNRAGYYLSGSSHNNIIIGDRTGPQGSYKNENYKLYIGDGATPLMTGSLESGNLSLSINGATTITTTLTLKPQHPLPTGALGSMAVSGSSLYFHNGTSWKGVLLDA